ncbi:MAG: insulinase family protein [Bacteroidales bacterium]|nr:insulinase family protein [Bacteroidales bacterium]
MKKSLLMTAALFGMSVALWAQQIPALPNDPATKVGKLDNGMTYYIRHNDKPAGRAEFYLATNVGAIQETPDQDGLAHFLEHMCFNGTKNFPGKGILDWLQSIGASFGGNVNASTGVEQTVYMLNNIPLSRPGVVDTCILIMHDYAHFVSNLPEEIDKERGVILEERRSRRNAAWRLYEQNQQYIFKGSKYAGCTVIGSQENLETFKPESLVNFYRTWCRPDMQALIIVGDIHVEEVEGKIKGIFADIPAPVNPEPKEVIKVPDNVQPLVGIVTDPEASSSDVSFIWKSEAMPEEYNNTQIGLVQDILRDIVSNVMNERFQDITAKAGAPFLDASFGAGNLCETMDAVFADVTFKDGEALTATEAMFTEVERMRRYGFSDNEIDRAKAEILSAYESASKKAESRKNSEFVQPMIAHFFDNKAFMEPSTAYQMAGMIMEQLTPQVINQVANQMITRENLVILYNGPEKAAKPTEEELAALVSKVQEADIDRLAGEEVPESFLDPSALTAGTIVSREDGISGSRELMLGNGLKLILLANDHEKNKIRFNIYRKGGRCRIATRDLPTFDDNIWGQYLSNTGVSAFSGTTVSKMLAGKDLSVSPYISEYTNGVRGQSSPQDFETALQLLHLYYTAPRFDNDEFQKGIKQLRTLLPNLQNNPGWALQQHLYPALFNSPRRFVLDENVLSKARLATLQKVYAQLFKDVSGATCIIVGDFNPDEILPLLQRYLGSLPGGRKKTDWKYQGDGIRNGLVKDDFKNAMETPKVTVVQVYSIEQPWTLKEEITFEALENILDMVYTETMREEEGGTYGAHTMSSCSNAPHARGMLQVVFETNTESADKLIAMAKEGLGKIAENGPEAEKFDRALKNLEKKIPENRITNRYWMEQLMQSENYGVDYDGNIEAVVRSLTPDDVKTLAARLLASGNFVEVIMRPE